MAAAVVEAFLGISGLTLTVDLAPLGSDTLAATAIAMTEATNRKGLYTGTTAAALTGEHQAFLKTGTTVVGLGYVVMDDTTSIHRIVDAAEVANIGGTQINAASVSGAVGSVTGNVGGNVVGSVASVVGATGSVTGLTASDVAAIKAKTDNLPASPAAVGSAMTLTSAYDLYTADIQFTEDNANTKDEYTATWFKNGVRVTSGITVPTIQVVKRADGTNLVASTAMTQIGTTGSYKYDEATNRVTVGEAVIAIVVATIDAASRSFARVISRDS